MAFDESLVERVRRQLARRKNIEEKKMFGGTAFLLNGNLLVGARRERLLVRVGPAQTDEALREDHATAFTIKNRGAMKGWVLVGLAGLTEESQLKDWMQRALSFVKTLPVK
jgi:TfoX/Sxy family transcriptional regulator of competence genes